MAEEYERRTPVFDWVRREFVTDSTGKVVTVTEEQAAEQIIIKALQTTRGASLIYSNVDDEDLDQKYGTDVPDIIKDGTLSREVKIDEIKRAIEEALIYLDWIEEVYDVAVNGLPGEVDAMEASCSVLTIFDRVIEVRGAVIGNA